MTLVVSQRLNTPPCVQFYFRAESCLVPPCHSIPLALLLVSVVSLVLCVQFAPWPIPLSGLTAESSVKLIFSSELLKNATEKAESGARPDC